MRKEAWAGPSTPDKQRAGGQAEGGEHEGLLAQRLPHEARG